MSNDSNDFYKASIGAADNLMSLYYQEEFRKIDETAKKEREKLTSPDFSFGNQQKEDDEDDFSFDAMRKTGSLTQEPGSEVNQPLTAEGAISFLKFLLISIFVLTIVGLFRS